MVLIVVCTTAALEGSLISVSPSCGVGDTWKLACEPCDNVAMVVCRALATLNVKRPVCALFNSSPKLQMPKACMALCQCWLFVCRVLNWSQITRLTHHITDSDLKLVSL